MIGTENMRSIPVHVRSSRNHAAITLSYHQYYKIRLWQDNLKYYKQGYDVSSPVRYVEYDKYTLCSDIQRLYMSFQSFSYNDGIEQLLVHCDSEIMKHCSIRNQDLGSNFYLDNDRL